MDTTTISLKNGMDMMHETKNGVERVYKTTVTDCMILCMRKDANLTCSGVIRNDQ